MQRSSRASRIAGNFSISSSSPAAAAASTSSSYSTARSLDEREQECLPTYNPLSHAAKKEQSRHRSAKNAIHVIPIVLLLCAIVLWFFSNPEKS